MYQTPGTPHWVSPHSTSGVSHFASQRKLHLAVNADTGEVLASDLTSRRTADCAWVPELLDQINDRVATFMADGAYDTGAVYEAAQEKGDGQGVTVPIPPGRGAQPSSIRSLVGQRVEVGLGCKILNTMTGLGRPDSVGVR